MLATLVPCYTICQLFSAFIDSSIGTAAPSDPLSPTPSLLLLALLVGVLVCMP